MVNVSKKISSIEHVIGSEKPTPPEMGPAFVECHPVRPDVFTGKRDPASFLFHGSNFRGHSVTWMSQEVRING